VITTVRTMRDSFHFFRHDITTRSPQRSTICDSGQGFSKVAGEKEESIL
jgi:hypothetical protein